MNNSRRVLQFFRPDAGLISIGFGLMLLSLVANLLKPWPLALVVDCLLEDRPWPGRLDALFQGWPKPAVLGALAGAMVLLHLAQASMAAGQNYLLIQAGLRGLARVRTAVFHWLERLSWRFHQGSRQGDMIYRATWDTYAFQTFFQQGVVTLAAASLSLALMVVVMSRLNGRLTLVALATVAGLAPVMRGFGRRMSARSAAAHQADSQVSSLVQQGLVALPLIQSYTAEAEAEATFTAQARRAYQDRLAQHGSEVWYLAAIAAVFGLGGAAIAWLGAHQVWAGRLTVGELLIFLAYLGQFYEPLSQLSHLPTTLADAGVGTRRVLEILDTPADIQDAPNARPVVRAGLSPAAAAAALEVRGALAWEGVWFGYTPERPILRDVTFTLTAGEHAAVIGPSGAGKTTLLHLLPRFFDPTCGCIRLDGADLRELRLEELRRQVALVMQEPVLLPATIAENIALGRPGASLEAIQTAARAAHADGFIRKLPREYDTLVGEGAARLSTGEKQRINLARAFLKDAPLLVLDEPTNALDPESEALVLSSLDTLARGRTTLMVTHRLSLTAGVDQILVFEEGRLTEAGSPEVLRSRPGYFGRWR